MLEDDPLGQKMHFVPFDSRFDLVLDRFLGLKDSCVDLSLFLVELTRNGESHGLISHISMPFTTHIKQNHLIGLNDLIVKLVVKSCAVAATGGDKVET